LGMVTQHCQRAILLDGGQIIKRGAAPDVVEHYQARTAAQSGS